MTKRAERRARLEEWQSRPQEAMEELSEWIESMGELGHLKGFCVAKDVPYTSVIAWIEADNDRAALYARVREERITSMAERLTELADADMGVTLQGGTDTGAVAHAKLRIDTRRWLLSKMAPKQYGDKLEVDANVKHDAVGDLREFLAGSRLPLRGTTTP